MEIKISNRLTAWLTPYGESLHKKCKINMDFIQKLDYNDFHKIFEGLVLNCR